MKKSFSFLIRMIISFSALQTYLCYYLSYKSFFLKNVNYFLLFLSYSKILILSFPNLYFSFTKIIFQISPQLYGIELVGFYFRQNVLQFVPLFVKSITIVWAVSICSSISKFPYCSLQRFSSLQWFSL